MSLYMSDFFIVSFFKVSFNTKMSIHFLSFISLSIDFALPTIAVAILIALATIAVAILIALKGVSNKVLFTF